MRAAASPSRLGRRHQLPAPGPLLHPAARVVSWGDSAGSKQKKMQGHKERDKGRNGDRKGDRQERQGGGRKGKGSIGEARKGDSRVTGRKLGKETGREPQEMEEQDSGRVTVDIG